MRIFETIVSLTGITRPSDIINTLSRNPAVVRKLFGAGGEKEPQTLTLSRMTAEATGTRMLDVLRAQEGMTADERTADLDRRVSAAKKKEEADLWK